MGAIGDAVSAYAQPLIDQTDGSLEQIQKAFALSQLCWNLALLPDKARDEALAEMRGSLNMDDAEFDDFRTSIVIPMVRRHWEMFPRSQEDERGSSSGPAAPPHRPMGPTGNMRSQKVDCPAGSRRT